MTASSSSPPMVSTWPDSGSPVATSASSTVPPELPWTRKATSTWRTGGNSRVQVLAPDGRFITEFRGDANLSQWAWEKMASNPNLVQQRSLLRDFSAERDMWHPCTVKVDEQGRVSILDSGRHRIQVYQKDKTPSLKY